MAETIVHQFLNHPRRSWMVGIATVATSVLIGIPLYDDFQSIRGQKLELVESIEEAQQAAEKLPELQERFEQMQSLDLASSKSLAPEQAIRLREEIVELIRKCDSRLLRATPGDPFTRSWGEKDDPFESVAPKGSEKSKYQLVTTKLGLVVEGSMPNLMRMIQELSSLHQMAVPTKLQLRQGGEEEKLNLDIEMTMFHLERRSS